MARIVFVVTSAATAEHFLRGQLELLSQRGWEVHLVTSPPTRGELRDLSSGVRVHSLPMRRRPAIWADGMALSRMRRLLLRIDPDIVHASTPKAGLLGMLASRLAGVRHRLYLLRGLRLETAGLLGRWIFGSAERAASRAATKLYAVSNSLKEVYLRHGLASGKPVHVLANGSSTGVDATRFTAMPGLSKGAARSLLELPADAPVVGFFGRLTADKGVPDLVDAFRDLILPAVPGALLLLVGEMESGDAIPADTRHEIEASSAIVHRPFCKRIEPYYTAIDVLAFPSYREGFPNVPLEAAAAGKPVAGYRATGTVDAVVDGKTGTLVPCGAIEALGLAVVRYLTEPDLARLHGSQGQRRAAIDFDPSALWAAWEAEYTRILDEGERP